MQFVLPADMTEGAWEVKVTTQYSNGASLVAVPRSYVMDAPLVIGENAGGGGESGGGGEIIDPTA